MRFSIRAVLLLAYLLLTNISCTSGTPTSTSAAPALPAATWDNQNWGESLWQ